METDTAVATKSPTAKRRKSPLRSRVVGNRSAFLPMSDGRTIWARVAKDTLQSLEIHCGGELSETQRLAARRVSVLEAELIFLEDEFAQARADGNEPDLLKVELYGRLADRQRRLAEPLGWRRTPRDVTPTLNAYLDAKVQAAEAEEPVA
jgi:hypothetical protein